MKTMKKIVILGAGITGLDIGWQLCKKGYDVVILERQDFIGGLATSIKHDEYKIDIGPHYISLPVDSERTEEIKELIGSDELVEVLVSVKVWFFGKLIDQYPTLFDVMFRYGPKFSFLSFGSFIMAKTKTTFSKKKFESAEECCINTYGKFLYEIWFKPRLIRRFGDPKNTTLNAASEIFPEISSKRIFSFLKKRSSQISIDVDYSKNSNDFYCKNGMGIFALKLKEEIEKYGGKIMLGTRIISVDHSDAAKSIIIEKDEKKEILADIIVYSTSPRIALSWFKEAPEHLKIQPEKSVPANSIMVFLFIDTPKLYDGWVIDVFDSSLIFFRIAQQNYLTDSVSPPGKTLLSVEIRSSDNDPNWKMDEKSIFEKVVRDLKKMRLISNQKIDGYKLMKLPRVYPVLNESSNQDSIIKYINSFKNEYTLGTVIADPGTLVSSKRKDEKLKKNFIGLTSVLSKTPSLVKKIVDENKI